MSFANKSLAYGLAAVILSAGAAMAQAGGPDTPTDAKSQGTMENGSSSTGMSNGSAMKHSRGMKKMKKKKHHM